jgi:4-alpha-glucanotransferase
MRLIFQLRFHTRFGQELFLTGAHEIFGGGDFARAIPLRYLNDRLWEVALIVPDSMLPREDLVYNYVLREPDGSLIYDWGDDKVVNLAASASNEIIVRDAWNHAGFFQNVFYTEPFKNVLLSRRPPLGTSIPPARLTHTFRAKAPLLGPNQVLCLTGNAPALNGWSAADPVLMSGPAGSDWFTVGLDLSETSFPVEYKYGVFDIEQRTFQRYEDGENRVLDVKAARGRQVIVNDGFAVLPSNTWRGTGVAIPVFSLRSERSFGVGEFTDLKLLADWCAKTNLRLIQILPVNDTTATRSWTDSYPYSAISAFALHPIYINLAGVAGKDGGRLLQELEPERLRLNQLPELDYEAVFKLKMSALRSLFESQKARFLKRGEVRSFVSQNRDWLEPYAAFCFLRDKFETADFARWREYSRYEADLPSRLRERHPDFEEALDFHRFVQFHLHAQLRDAADYAHQKGIILKGDIPIGVSRYGADAWQEPELYHMDQQAGAPPDAFAIKGQNWGFPTYNWQKMRLTGYEWWRRRFHQMSHYFDAFRVDHILGFFRIWSVPLNAVEGILGRFVPALPVTVEELAACGFDTTEARGRLTLPWITEEVLEKVFGPLKHKVKESCVVPDGEDRFRLRPEFATQRQVEQAFAKLGDNPENVKVRDGLFDLISNVVLFGVSAEAGRPEFHFRFAVESTLSFQALGAESRRKLNDLYIDYFYRRQEALWTREAWEKLVALKRSTRMMICGEDLGLVPACVPEVMARLGLLSLEIQRMPKRMSERFFRPANAPYLSVITPSTHDMSPIRGWWQEDLGVTQAFYNDELGENGPAPVGDCPAEIVEMIVAQHLESPALWSVFQLQDLLGMDRELRLEDPARERINDPANPRHYWRYRMHICLEALNSSERFNSRLAELCRKRI